MRVFVSYSRKNKNSADAIAAFLRKCGADVFIDYQRLAAGEIFPNRLRDEITRCNAMVLLMSKHSASSKWVQDEVMLARHLEKMIVPILLDKLDVSRSAFWFLMRTDWVVIENGAFETALIRVASALGLEEPSVEHGSEDDSIGSVIPGVFDPNRIKDTANRELLTTMLMYRRAIEVGLPSLSKAVRESMQNTLQDLDNWLAHAIKLASTIDAFHSNELLKRDKEKVPLILGRTRARLKNESDKVVRDELNRTIETLQKQLDNISELERSVDRAQLQLESTASSYGTVYAQFEQLRRSNSN